MELSPEEDADPRENLASLGPGAIADLKRVLEGSQTYRHAPSSASSWHGLSSQILATLIAMANSDGVVRLRLVRTIRDVEDRMSLSASA